MSRRIKPHLPIFTKHRKNKGQFKRKKNHWCEVTKVMVYSGKTVVIK